jgi:hypothetical protein
MPRFVILCHELPLNSPRASHFDLMLEHDGVLRTWACDKVPAPGESVRAERLADHRLAYLDYEGPVSCDRGDVQRVAVGTYEVVVDDDSQLRVRLLGDSLRGVLTLERLPGEPQRFRVSLAAG